MAAAHDGPDDFCAAIRAAGLTPPDAIDAGRFHRFPGVGKRNGNTAGFCKLFHDGMGGVFGDSRAASPGRGRRGVHA